MRQAPAEEHERQDRQAPHCSRKENGIMTVQQVVVHNLDASQAESQQPQNQQHAERLIPIAAEFSRIVKIETVREQQNDCCHRNDLDVSTLDEKFVIETQRKAAVWTRNYRAREQ